MYYYTTFGDLQHELDESYHQNGQCLQFPEAIHSLYVKGKLSDTPLGEISALHSSGGQESCSFDSQADRISFAVSSDISVSENVFEGQIIPPLRDIYIIRHPRHTRPCLHRHDYVEIDLVTDGSCLLYFEDTVQTLQEGDLCLVAPHSLHDIEIRDDSTVFCIMLRRSTFETTFFSLLFQEDALSLFFRNILNGEREANYLIFHTERLSVVNALVQNAMLECFKPDSYSNSCCISYVNLLLADFLRVSGQTPRYYHYQASTEFSLILQYIRNHYQSLTLSALAAHFHYSKPHMCTLIHQNTGVTFTEMIRQIRMHRASEYLLDTDLPVGRIGEIVGYHSADHFTRVFRGVYACSPQEYRHTHRK